MRCLAEHPQICGSKPKEVHFFDRHYDEGFAWYAQHFAQCGNEQLYGEYTPGYLGCRRCAQRIGEAYPEAKLIVCLRAPLDKVISSYHYAYSRGKTGKDIDAFIHAYDLESLLFYWNIERYRQYYADEQLLVTLFEDIKPDPQQFMQRIFEYLGVDTSFEPSALNEKRNVTVKNTARFRWLNRALWNTRYFIKNAPGAHVWVTLLRKSGINRVATRIFHWNRRPVSETKRTEKVNPSPQTVQMVLDHCREDIQQLERYLNRDLSHWYDKARYL